MLNALLRFEFAYHSRQLMFRAAILLFLGLGVVATQGRFGGDDVHPNSPYVITYLVGFLSLFSAFVGTLFCANVVLRDTTYRMDAILYATPVGRFAYFASRFVGLLCAVFLVLCSAVVGIAVGSILLKPGQTGPFDLWYVCQPLLVFGLPNVLFTSCSLFCVALFARNLRALYATGMLLYVLYLLGSILGNSPLFANAVVKTTGLDMLSVILDPFGLSAFFGETRSWSDEQRNTQLFPVGQTFLLNRLLWASLSCLLLAATYRYFPFRLPASSKTTSKKQRVSPVRYVTYRRAVVQTKGALYGWTTLCSQLTMEVISLLKDIPFMVMLGLWIFVFTVDVNDALGSGMYGIRISPSTGVMVDELRFMRPAMLLLIFYAADLLEREREANMQALVYTTPVPSASMWAAKTLTLGVLVAILVSANVAIGVAVQLINGYAEIDFTTYLSLYYYSGLPLFLLAVLAVFIQAVSPNKYLGMLLNVVVAVVLLFSRRLGLEHFLLRYATVPDLQFSEMNGFGHYKKAFFWYMLYWSAFAVVLSCLTVAVWQRSLYQRWWQRITAISTSVSRLGALIGIAGLLAWMSAGAYIYYQTNVVGTYRTRKNQIDWQIRYEKKYQPLSKRPQPVITSVKTAVAIHPKEGRYTVKGRYVLKNESNQPLSIIWVGVDPEVTRSTITISEANTLRHDAEFDQYWFSLTKPLEPGAELTMTFTMDVVRSGFMPFNNEHSVVENGTYIELEKYVPQLGYNSRYEADDATSRKEGGLPEKNTVRSGGNQYHLIHYETTISTEPDQYVVTVGDLLKSWTANNRRFFSYKTSAPINFMFALSSARYVVHKEKYKNVELRICYQPGWARNVATMMQAMKDALDYGNNQFSTYPLKRLTLAEIPHYRGAATAYSGVLFSAERINFMGDFRDTSRLNYGHAIVAHEVSHQWWANKVAPVYGPGQGLLTESLAKYAEAMITEKAFGKMKLRQYLQADNQLYFSMRNLDGTELPLRTSDQPAVYYQKGGLVMYAIKEELGEAKMNRALRRLISKHAYPGTKATVDDLVRELGQEASPIQRKRISDWLNKVIVYSMNVRVVSCRSLPTGQFRVMLRVTLAKTDQNQGKLPPDDLIDVALFDQFPDDWNQTTKPIYLQKHSITKNETLITLTVSKRPKAVAIDPYGYVLDENPADNVVYL